MPKRKPRKPPKIGAEFVREFKGKRHTLKVVDEDGRVGYRVGAKTYRSPTGAAKSITGTEVNGWSFWKIG
jgi:hypothetical protein